jgi:hypothetical protein
MPIFDDRDSFKLLEILMDVFLHFGPYPLKLMQSYIKSYPAPMFTDLINKSNQLITLNV